VKEELIKLRGHDKSYSLMVKYNKNIDILEAKLKELSKKVVELEKLVGILLGGI